MLKCALSNIKKIKCMEKQNINFEIKDNMLCRGKPITYVEEQDEFIVLIDKPVKIGRKSM